MRPYEMPSRPPETPGMPPAGLSIGAVRRIFLPDTGNIVGGFDPFFAKAARGAKISCYLDGTKDGGSDADVVSGTKGASLARDSNDVGGLTLWARLGTLHGDPRQRGARSPSVSSETSLWIGCHGSVMAGAPDRSRPHMALRSARQHDRCGRGQAEQRLKNRKADSLSLCDAGHCGEVMGSIGSRHCKPKRRVI